MAYQAVFQRYELKYLISRHQQARLLRELEQHLAPDRYGLTTIRNIYFDTDNYLLIRRSLEKPLYKEKLRLRSYDLVSDGSPVFVELKKKYAGIVYKRRLKMPEAAATDWLCGNGAAPPGQIGREIDYVRGFYQELKPTVFLSYDRQAYCCRNESDLRLTFDCNIRCRQEGLSLSLPPGGHSLLKDDHVLMEIKTSGGIPLWLTEFLTRERIFRTSFSKYGTAYQTLILPTTKGGYFYAGYTFPGSF